MENGIRGRENKMLTTWRKGKAEGRAQHGPIELSEVMETWYCPILQPPATVAGTTGN